MQEGGNGVDAAAQPAQQHERGAETGPGAGDDDGTEQDVQVHGGIGPTPPFRMAASSSPTFSRFTTIRPRLPTMVSTLGQAVKRQGGCGGMVLAVGHYRGVGFAPAAPLR